MQNVTSVRCGDLMSTINMRMVVSFVRPGTTKVRVRRTITSTVQLYSLRTLVVVVVVGSRTVQSVQYVTPL